MTGPRGGGGAEVGAGVGASEGGEGASDGQGTHAIDPTTTIDRPVHDEEAEKVAWKDCDGTVGTERKRDQGREVGAGAEGGPVEPRQRRGDEEKKEGDDDGDGDGSTDARASPSEASSASPISKKEEKKSSSSSPSSPSSKSQPSTLPPPPPTFVDDVDLDPKIRLQHYYHTLTPRVTLSTRRNFVDDNDYRRKVSASSSSSRRVDEASKSSAATVVKEPEKFWRSRFVCPVTKREYHSCDNLGTAGPEASLPAATAATAASTTPAPVEAGGFWYHPTKRAAQRSAALSAASSILVVADPGDEGGQPSDLDGVVGGSNRPGAASGSSASTAEESSATKAISPPSPPPTAQAPAGRQPPPASAARGGRGIPRNLACRLFDLDVGITSPSDIVAMSVSHVLVPPPPPPPPPSAEATGVPIFDEVFEVLPPSREVPTLLRCSMTVKLPDHLLATDGENRDAACEGPAGANDDSCGAEDDDGDDDDDDGGPDASGMRERAIAVDDAGDGSSGCATATGAGPPIATPPPSRGHGGALTVLGEPCHNRYRAVRSAVRLLEAEVHRRRGGGKKGGGRGRASPPPQARRPPREDGGDGEEVEADREGDGEEEARERSMRARRAQFLKRMKLSGPVRVDYLFPLSRCFITPFFRTFPPSLPSLTSTPAPAPPTPSLSDSPATGGGCIDEYVYLYELTLKTTKTNIDGGGLPLSAAMGFDHHQTTRIGVAFPCDIECKQLAAPLLTVSGTPPTIIDGGGVHGISEVRCEGDGEDGSVLPGWPERQVAGVAPQQPRHVGRVDMEGRDDHIRGVEATLTGVRRIPWREFFLVDHGGDGDEHEQHDEDTSTSTRRRRRWPTRWEMLVAFNENVLNWRQYGFFKMGYQKWGQGKRKRRKKMRGRDGGVGGGGDGGDGNGPRGDRRPYDPLLRTYLFVPLVRRGGLGDDRKRRRPTRGGGWRERDEGDDGDGVSGSSGKGGSFGVDENDVEVDWDLLDRAHRHRLTPFLQATTGLSRSGPPVPWTDRVRALRLARRVCCTLATVALSVPFLRRSLRGVHTMKGWTDEVIDLADVTALGCALIPGLVIGLMRLWALPRRPPVGVLKNRFLTNHDGKLCVYVGDEENDDSPSEPSLLRVHWVRCHANFDMSRKKKPAASSSANKDIGKVPIDSLFVLPMPRDVLYSCQHAARFMEPLERAVELSHLEGRMRHLGRMAQNRLMGRSGGTTAGEEGKGVDNRRLLPQPCVAGRRNRPRLPPMMIPSLRSLVAEAATIFPRITYERLEFLGDAVLGHFVAINVFSRNSSLAWDVDDVQERKDHACKNGVICEAALRVGINRVVVSGRRPWRSAYDARPNSSADLKGSGKDETLLLRSGSDAMRHFTGNVSDKNIADVTEALLAAAYLGEWVDSDEEMMHVDTLRRPCARTGSYVIGLLDELELPFEPPVATAARRTERPKEGEDVENGEHQDHHQRSWFAAPGACIDRGYPLDVVDDWRRRIDDIGSIIENDHEVGTRLRGCLDSFLRLLDRVSSSPSPRPSSMAKGDGMFNERDRVLLMASLFDDSLGCVDDDSDLSGSCSSSTDGSCTSDAGSSFSAEDGLVRVALLRDSMFAVGNASILLCLTEEIYRRFPDATPGDMHLLRTVVLGDDPLVYVMMKNGIHECLYDSEAESASKFKREMMIADALGIDSWKERGGWVLNGGLREFHRRYAHFVNDDVLLGHDDTQNDEGHITTVLPQYVGLVGGRLRGHNCKVDPKITRDLVFSMKVIVGALVLSVGLDVTCDLLLPMFTELLLLSPDELRNVYGHLSTISRTYQRG